MKDNVIQSKSYLFALRCIKLYQFLTLEKREFVLANQVLRSGTSIGANVEEADAAQSKKDFISKLSIALKEAKETHYWIRLLHDSHYLDKNLADSLIKDCTELIAILTSILKTSRTNL